jgi:hypothetical protein
MTGSYWWFQGQSVEHLLMKLQDAGPDARLEVHPGPEGKLFLKVVDADKQSGDPINDSHLCPPDCP